MAQTRRRDPAERATPSTAAHLGLQRVVLSVVSALFLTASFHAVAQPDADKPEKLVMWSDVTEDQIALNQELARQFQEMHGIEVEVVPLHHEEQVDQLTLDGPAGIGPDLVEFPHSLIGNAATLGLITPLEGELEIEPDFLDQFLDVAIDGVSYNGSVYGIPHAIDTYALYYNTDLVSKPPETFDELKEIARQHTNPDETRYGFLYWAGAFYYDHAFLSGLGGYIFGKNEDGSYNLDDIGLSNSGAQEGAAFIKSFFEEGLIPSDVDYNVMDAQFREGKAAMIINGPWAVSGYADTPGLNFAVAPLPALNAGGVMPISLNGLRVRYISAFSANKVWARELLLFLTSKEALQMRYEATNMLPPRKDMVEALADDPYLGPVLTQIRTSSEPMPNVPEMNLVWTPMGNAINLIIRDELPVEQALNNAVEEIRLGIEEQQ